MFAFALLPFAGISAWLLATQHYYDGLTQLGLAGLVILALAGFARAQISRMNKQLDEKDIYIREKDAYIREIHKQTAEQIIPAAVRLAEVADRMLRHLEAPR